MNREVFSFNLLKFFQSEGFWGMEQSGPYVQVVTLGAYFADQCVLWPYSLFVCSPLVWSFHREPSGTSYIFCLHPFFFLMPLLER